MSWHFKQLQGVRRGVATLVAVLVLAPVGVVWVSLPAASASRYDSSTSLFPVALQGSSTPTLRAKVTGVPPSAVTPTRTVTFTIEGSGPIACDDLANDTVEMSGGVATCKVTSGLPAVGSSETVQATYSGDDNFIVSDGSYTSNDGSFTPGDGTWQCVTSAQDGSCPYGTDPNIEGNAGGAPPEVDQNVWSPINGWSQTLYANSPEDWQVVASEPAGNTAVVTYPNTYAWVNVDNIPVDSYNTTVSSFNETMPHNAQTTAWAMYDLWFNNWNDEVMIQYDFTNNADCDSSTVVANNVTFGGSNGVPAQQWHLCDFGLPSAGPGGCPAGPNCTLDWKLGATEGAGKQSESSGSIDIKAMIDWLETNGYLPASSTWTALSDGWEICSTGGQNETFKMNDFSVTAS